VIRYAIEHLIADIAESGTTLPWNRWDRRLEKCLESEVARIVNEFSMPGWTLPPDFIPALFEHEVVDSRPDRLERPLHARAGDASLEVPPHHCASLKAAVEQAPAERPPGPVPIQYFLLRLGDG
jgi:hypothetical protein